MCTHTCCLLHHLATDFQTGNMSNCTEIQTFYLNLKYFEVFFYNSYNFYIYDLEYAWILHLYQEPKDLHK